MRDDSYQHEDVPEDEDDGVGGLKGHLLPCYDCTRAQGLPVHDDDKCVKQPVVSYGPVVNDPFDPTQSYKLSCGHYTI